MAPILSTAIGVTPQIIDDPSLQKLIELLNEFEPKQPYDLIKQQDPEEVIAPLDIAALVAAIEPHQSWAFEEQVCCCICLELQYSMCRVCLSSLQLTTPQLDCRWTYTNGFQL